MKKETIKFSVGQDGSVAEEVIGLMSGECLDLTKEIENQLGIVDSREFKPEHYLAQPIDNFWKQQTDVTLQQNQN